MAIEVTNRRSLGSKLAELSVFSLIVYSLAIFFVAYSAIYLLVLAKRQAEGVVNAEILWNSDNIFNVSSHQEPNTTTDYGEPTTEIHEAPKEVSIEAPKQVSIEIPDEVSIKAPEEASMGMGESCDMAKGKWVFDESYPLYDASKCRIIDEGFNCQSNGRMDSEYTKWRWVPEGCVLPRFNATNMLNMLRGKRVVFAGDSLNRNQWESLLCLLMAAVKDPRKVYETRGRKIVKTQGDYAFRFVEHRSTVEFHVSHFLVKEGKMRFKKKRVETLQIDRIDRGSRAWVNADVLVFNSAHWWTHSKTKSGVNYFQEGRTLHQQLDMSEAFRRAMATWANWVDQNVNPKRTRVFFRSAEPSHFSGGGWNSGGHCSDNFRPEMLSGSAVGTGFEQINDITGETIRGMKTPVTILNVTGLSNARFDAHPSKYILKGSSLGPEDCSHWCLPGVPDTWNELLYNHLLH